MIAHVSGEVVEYFGNTVIVDVGGVGYEVQVSTSEIDSMTLNQPIKFYTYHHIREQAEELFGFSSLAAKKIFELLITVQGIGPKAALSILSLGTSEQVRNAIANSDSAFVTGASGVGKKTAERVVVDLADKVGLPTYYDQKPGAHVALHTNDEALEALTALGYTLVDATKALEGVDVQLPTSQRVKDALRNSYGN
jgi:Holliday junction DNA helicase RuvA